MATAKVWTIDDISNLLQKNNTMVKRSLLQLYDRQTEDEKDEETASYSNGCGFNGVDAPLLTSFAKFYKARGYLTMKQLEICRKKLMKYCKQITRIANHEI